MCPLVLGCRFRSWSPRSPCTCRQYQWWLPDLTWCTRAHTTGTIMYTGDTTIIDTGDITIMGTGDTAIIRGGTTAGVDYRAPLGPGNITTMTMRQSPGVDRFS